MKIAALICTVLAGLGGIVLLTDSSPVSECLPPTVLFTVAAAVCWVLFCKKNREGPAVWKEPENKRTPATKRTETNRISQIGFTKISYAKSA